MKLFRKFWKPSKIKKLSENMFEYLDQVHPFICIIPSIFPKHL